MRNKLYIALVFFSVCLNAQPPSKWIRRFGAHGIDIGYGVKQGFYRQYIAVGSTSSFGVGGHDAYAILVDSMGQKIWEKTYGGAMADVAKRVVVNPADSGFIFAGYTSSIGFGGYDVYVVRLDKNGNIIWQRSFGGLDWDFGNDIVLAPDGNVIICGYTYSFGYGKRDGYILKVNSSNGALMWQKSYGGAEDDEFRALSISSSTALVIVGETKSYDDASGDIYFIKTNLSGDSIVYKSHGLPNKQDYANSVIDNVTFNGYVLGGGTESYSGFGMDAFIFGVNLVGDSLWLTSHGNANVDQEALKVIPNVSNTGTYVISYSDIDFPTFKRDPKNLILDDIGQYYSANTFGGNEDDELKDLQNTSDEGYIGIGYTKSFGSAQEDLYLIKYDSATAFGGNLIGIEENTMIITNTIKVYPTIISRANDLVNINYDGEFTYSLIDIYGKKIIDVKSINKNSTQFSINYLENGIYFLNVQQGSKITCFKVVKRD